MTKPASPTPGVAAIVEKYVVPRLKKGVKRDDFLSRFSGLLEGDNILLYDGSGASVFLDVAEAGDLEHLETLARSIGSAVRAFDALSPQEQQYLSRCYREEANDRISFVAKGPSRVLLKELPESERRTALQIVPCRPVDNETITVDARDILSGADDGQAPITWPGYAEDLTSTDEDVTWSPDITDDIMLRLNLAFAEWTDTYPNGWTDWESGGVVPIKETTLVRVGKFAVKYSAAAETALGMQVSSDFSANPLPAGTFLSGSVDMYLSSVISGLPGLMIRLHTNAAETTYVDTKVQPQNLMGQWQRIPWTARVGSDQQIYKIIIHVMASWSSFASGAFTGTVIYDNVRFALCDSLPAFCAMPLCDVLHALEYILTGTARNTVLPAPRRQNIIGDAKRRVAASFINKGPVRKGETWAKTALVWNARMMWGFTTFDRVPDIPGIGSAYEEFVAELILALGKDWDVQATFRAAAKKRREISDRLINAGATDR